MGADLLFLVILVGTLVIGALAAAWFMPKSIPARFQISPKEVGPGDSFKVCVRAEFDAPIEIKSGRLAFTCERYKVRDEGTRSARSSEVLHAEILDVLSNEFFDAGETIEAIERFTVPDNALKSQSMEDRGLMSRTTDDIVWRVRFEIESPGAKFSPAFFDVPVLSRAKAKGRKNLRKKTGQAREKKTAGKTRPRDRDD